MKTNQLNRLSVEKFLSYNLHSGTSRMNWDVSSKPFLQGIRHKFCVFQLSETHVFLRQSLKFLKKILFQKKKILFVGAPKGMEKEFALLCTKNQHYWIESWPYGFFTNSEGVSSLKDSLSMLINEKPSLIFVFDLSLNQKVKEEALNLDIPFMAFVNTDESFYSIDYPIPANIKSWKGGLFVYNIFFHLFHLYKKN